MVSALVIELADRLTNLLPPGLDRATFLSTGGEANEFAIKLAKTIAAKFEVDGLLLSWYAMNAAANSYMQKAGRAVYNPMTPGSLILPNPNAYIPIFRNHDGS